MGEEYIQYSNVYFRSSSLLEIFFIWRKIFKMNTLTKKKRLTTKDVTYLGVMAALAVVLAFLIRIPWPAAPFLEYDPADVPIFIVTFAFGPIPGLILTVIVSFVQGLTVSAGSGIIGIVMHIAATGTAALVAGYIYKRNKTKGTAVKALVSAVAAMTGVMLVMNLWLTPIFMGTPVEAVLGMIVPIILPFNLVKAGLNAVIAFGIYKVVGKIFRDNWERKQKALSAEPVESGQDV